MRGLPKSIIKKYGISKKAWRIYRGRKSSRSRTVKSKTTKHKGGKKMARRKKRKRKGGSSLITKVEKLLGIGAFVYPGVKRATDIASAEGMGARSVIEGVSLYAGIKDGQWSFGNLGEAWMPYLSFVLVSKGVHKISGLIRRL